MRLLSYIKDNYNKPPLKTFLIVVGSVMSIVIGYWLCVTLTCLYSNLLLQIGCNNEPKIFCGCSNDPTTFYGTYFFAGIFSLGFTIICLSVIMAILFGIYYGIYAIYKLCYECYKINKKVNIIDDSNTNLPV